MDKDDTVKIEITVPRAVRDTLNGIGIENYLGSRGKEASTVLRVLAQNLARHRQQLGGLTWPPNFNGIEVMNDPIHQARESSRIIIPFHHLSTDE